MSQETLDRACGECGGAYELVTQPGVFVYRGVEIPVEEEFFRCRACGEERVTWEQAGAREAAAAAAYREMEGLLPPEQMRVIRESRLGLTQAAFERALGLGEKTVARWESGRVVQNRATDHLFRLLERDPSALHFLAEHMGAADALPSRKREASPWRVAIPRALAARIQRAAEEEGVHPDAYAAMMLTEQIAAQELSAKMERMHETLLSMRHEWERTSLAQESAEPWKRSYDAVQREYAHAA